MTLLELTSKITNIYITIMCQDKDQDGDNHYTLIYRGESSFFRPTADECDLLVRHISPHRECVGELFVMCEE